MIDVGTLSLDHRNSNFEYLAVGVKNNPGIARLEHRI
jgi:hypothetical protein